MSESSVARWGGSRDYLAPLVIAGLALLAVAYFDLQTNVPFLDEWARRWTVSHFVDGKGLALTSQSPSLVQAAFMAVPAYFHAEPRAWRLTVLPFLALDAVFTGLTARRLGADRFWSSVAGAASITSPLFLNMATGVMTEIAYTGLMMAALYFSVRWVADGRFEGWCTLFTLLAISQRQQGAFIPIGVAIGLAIASRRRPITRRDVVHGFLLIVSAAALTWVLTYTDFGRTARNPGGFGKDPSNALVVDLKTVMYLPAMVGLVTSPFLVAALSRPARELVSRRRIDLLPVGLGVAGLSAAAMLTLRYGLTVLPGPVFTRQWLGPPISLAGHKPDAYPIALFAVMEATVVATFAVLLIWRRRAWRSGQLSLVHGMLVVQGALQLVPIIVYKEILDRYYIEALAPIVPVVASLLITQMPRPLIAKAWALAALGLSLVIYGVGEQDYVAWQVARDRAAQAAYGMGAPSDVEAGLEEDAQHVWIPAADSPGREHPLLVSNPPRFRLALAGPNDTRPGFTYNSAAPGKVIIEPGTP